MIAKPDAQQPAQQRRGDQPEPVRDGRQIRAIQQVVTLHAAMGTLVSNQRCSKDQREEGKKCGHVAACLHGHVRSHVVRVVDVSHDTKVAPCAVFASQSVLPWRHDLNQTAFTEPEALHVGVWSCAPGHGFLYSGPPT